MKSKYKYRNRKVGDKKVALEQTLRKKMEKRPTHRRVGGCIDDMHDPELNLGMLLLSSSLY